jgi:predicted lipid-binding transport protein (Tim44 family)
MIFIKKIFSLILVLSLVIVLSSVCWGRAGGGGGGHSGGGGGSHSSGSRSSYSSSSYGRSYGGNYGGNYSSGNSSGFMFFFLFSIIVIIFFMLARKNNRGLSTLEDERQTMNLFNNSSFQIEALDADLTKKISIAFLTIQKSWSEKRLDLMRRFITDGVYQRFNAQFTMMKLLDQTNIMRNVKIEQIGKVDSGLDGNYEILQARITAYSEDQFVSKTYPNLNSPGGAESFVEYWSFIRRKDYQKGFDLYSSENCPKCSAPLNSKLIETAQCPFCSTYLNNGEYDWVLAEITQENDYANAERNQGLSAQITNQLPDFSRQLIEDRASNAFMQILIATSLKSEAPLARFTTPSALLELKKFMANTHFCYDRLFLNSVEAVHAFVKENSCFVNIEIRFSFRRVQIQGSRAKLIDDDINTHTMKLVMVRELGGVASKGSIYANSCSHCGAAQKDSLASTCIYCGVAINDPKTEWLVDQISGEATLFA